MCLYFTCFKCWLNDVARRVFQVFFANAETRGNQGHKIQTATTQRTLGIFFSTNSTQLNLIHHHTLSTSPRRRIPLYIANMVYVRQEQLPNLKQYKYSAVDHSLVSKYILKPFYTNFVIKCFPMWMAPNLVTLSGFGFVVINMITMLWYCPGLDQDCPPWVYASWAVGLFLYQTFDAVDGSQA